MSPKLGGLLAVLHELSGSCIYLLPTNQTEQASEQDENFWTIFEFSSKFIQIVGIKKREDGVVVDGDHRRETTYRHTLALIAKSISSFHSWMDALNSPITAQSHFPCMHNNVGRDHV
jgi:hypothetical protein